MIPTYQDNNVTFTIFCFVLRISQALGISAAAITIVAIATTAFPGYVSTVMGLMETSIGLGMVMGPTLGGVVYELGGFLAPFCVVGIPMMLVSFLLYFICPEDNIEDNRATASIGSILKVPIIDLILITLLVSALLWTGLDPILQPHFMQFGLTPSMVGLVSLLRAGMYMLFAPIAGRIADYLDNKTPLMIVGFATLTLGMLLLGPSDLLGLGNYNELWLNLLSLSLIGVGVCLAVVPTMNMILGKAQKAGIPTSPGTNGLVAGIWTSVFCAGDLIGPVYFGTAYETIGFSWTTTIVAMATFLMFLLTVGIYLYEKDLFCPKDGEYEEEQLLNKVTSEYATIQNNGKT